VFYTIKQGFWGFFSYPYNYKETSFQGFGNTLIIKSIILIVANKSFSQYKLFKDLPISPLKGIGIALLLLVFIGCSTNKNTSTTRRYRAMLTKYNIAFNGNMSYKEGMDNIAKANKDDYSQIIHLFPISNHNTASSAAGNMDRVIEKNRKAIKLHSIKKKPERDYRKMRDPKYQAWYNQTEFNPELRKAWIQLGKAEFHKGDFLGSVGTFSYITRHYASVPEVVSETQIWMARAYSELDWLYEAEDVLKKIKKEHIAPQNNGLYASAWADLLIKQNEYKQAIPYLKTAIEVEKNKKQRARFNYVMAQLLEKTGDKEGAIEHYSRVIKTSPPYEMDFNARISRVQLLSKNSASVERELKRMARNRNNKDYLDQIYTALGNIFLNEKDSAKAIEYYNLAIEKSTRNGVEKGVSLVTMGDLYYKKREYVKAHPFYDEAAKIYTNEYDDFERISHRSEILADLVKEYEVVHLQDSLQALANMSEKDRLLAINRVIDKIKEDEKKEAEEKLIAQNRMDDDFAMPMQPIGVGAGDWYFYNPMNVNNGKNEFRRRWGNRKLEDNWRRSNKSASLFTETTELQDSTLQVSDSTMIAGNDTTAISDPNIPQFTQTSDKKSVDYYLALIPFTQAQKEKSNEQIATGLYNMGFVYKDKIEDYPLAYKIFAEFQKRFPTDERILETLYHRFLLASKENNPTLADQFRSEILANYADSKYAEMLADPNFIRNQQRMFEEQDFIYGETYTAFTKSDYKTVFANTEEMKRKFPLSNLLPQFEFLNTLSIGKTEGSEKFEASLNALVENYPESSIGAMSKDILALLKQGNIAQQGKTFGSLLTKREQENLTPEEKEAQSFSETKFTPHRMMLITDADDDAINKLQYNLAIFNFSRFMIKDFGFQLTQVDAERRALSVMNLASYNEGIWYQNSLATDAELVKQMEEMHVEQVIISEDNFGKLRTIFTLDDYLAFNEEVLSKDVPMALLTADETPIVAEKKQTTVEIIDGTKLPPIRVMEEQKSETEHKKEETVQNVEQSKAVSQNRNISIPTEMGSQKQATTQQQTVAQNKPDEQVKPAQQKQTETKKAKEIETVKPTEKKEVEQPKQAEQKATETEKPKEKEAQKPTQKQQAEQPKQKEQKSIDVPKSEDGGQRIIAANPPTRGEGDLYKNLYAYEANAPHFVAFYIPRGGRFDFEQVKKALDDYNAANYATMNLKVTLEEFGRESIIFVSRFSDANVAKSYFLRMLKEPTIRQATSGMNKRNLITTRDNLNTMLHNNALDVYFEFMREYYLK